MGSLNNMSLVYWYQGTEKHRCGYCKNEYGSISNGMWAETLTVEDYQNLIDRGWRRSGCYCYKPIMQETCCPQYTIKCDTINFQLSKSQRKVIKKFNKYLQDGVLSKNDVSSEAQGNDIFGDSEMFIRDRPNINFSVTDNPSHVTKGNLDMDTNLSIEDSQCTKSNFNSKNNESVLEPSNGKCNLQRLEMKNAFKEGIGASSSKPPCKKAKLLRIERKKEKLVKLGMTLEKKEPKQIQKSIEQFMEEISQNPKHNLRITLVRMSRNHEFFAASAKLFEKYQTVIHNETAEDSDPQQFFSFLVQTPLEPVNFPNGIDGPGYGSFHQQYWIDNKLVAVGVIDILPRCVSSVYFFYDPDYRNLTLGTYGSLREVQFIRSLQRKIPQLSNYYMGFYIHSCQKMRYKGKLVPSYLLCPETYHWVPIEKCLEKLDVVKYTRLEEDIDAVDENFPTSKDIDEMKIVYGSKLMYFKQYRQKQPDSLNMFTEIGTLIGTKCTKSIICIT